MGKGEGRGEKLENSLVYHSELDAPSLLSVS